MKKLKNIKKIILSVVCGLFMLCMGVSFASINCGYGILQTQSAVADVIQRAVPTSSGWVNVDEILNTNYANDTSRTHVFNGANLDKLYKYLGGSSADFRTIKNLAPSISTSISSTAGPFNSASFRARNGNKDITVIFGNVQWMPVELFKNNNGDVGLALLQKNATVGKYKITDYASTSSNVNYPANMYGVTRMRADYLGNGGTIATSTNTYTTTVAKATSGTYAKYTNPNVSGTVNDFMLKASETYAVDLVPKSVITGSGDSLTTAFFERTFNDSLNTPSQYSYNTNVTTYYSNKSYANSWKDDYVLLPSIFETGRTASQGYGTSYQINGRWALSSNQYETSNGYWLRTLNAANANQAQYLRSLDATGRDTYNACLLTDISTLSIRPCIFLNLTKAEEAKGYTTVTPTNVSATYTGSDLTSKFTSASWYNANQMTITYDKTRYNYTTVGSHVATVTAKEGYYFGSNPNTTTVNVTLTINKAAVTAPTNKSYNYDGKEHKFETESWYNSSIMTITPTESDYNYTDVRLYTATVTLTNTNYYFSGLSTSLTSTSVSISITKQVVQKPNVQDVVYDGQKHGFKTRTWWNPNLMTISLTDEQDDDIVNVGTYRATLSLPNDNYRWSDGDSKDTEVVTTINARVITPADITLEYDGEEHRDSELTNQTWFNTTYLTTKFEDGKNYTDVGNYKVTLTSIEHPNVVFSGNPNTKTWDINLTITKKRVNVQKFEVDENGELLSTSTLALAEMIYARDEGTDKAPILALQYSADGSSWVDAVPTHAGRYYVQAYISNAGTSNYQLVDAGRITFMKSKGLVYMPRFSNDDVVAGNNGAQILERTIYGWTTQIRYTGQEQVFKLLKVDGSEPTRINIGSMTGGLKYDADTQEFRATDVGVYTVNITVKDPDNEQWDNHDQNLSSIRTITLEILKAEIQYQIVDDANNTWEAGKVQNISINFTGTDFSKAATRPVVSVYAGEQGSPEEVEKNDVNFVYSEDKLVVNVNIASYQPNQYYEILVELSNQEAINKNYELKSIGSTITGDAYEFFITTAVIKNLEIEWLYSNPAISTGIKVESAGLSVEYNEYDYHFKLNEMLLPNGISVTYANETYINANTAQNPNYKTTATLKADDGSKFDPTFSAVESFVICRYVDEKTVIIELDWTITPTNFDLRVLSWLEDFTYNRINQTMDIANCPTWIRKSDAPGGTNYASAVGDYTAIYRLNPDGNHKFVNESNLDWIDIQNDGSALVSHVWHINKIVILVSDREEDWNFISCEDAALNWYEYPVPNALREYASQLVVTYYRDAGFSDLIDDITKIDVPLGRETWLYAKVELSSLTSITDLYDIKNMYDDSKNYAYLTFKVGDRRNLLEVTLNFDENGTFYNGQGQEVIVTCPDLDLGRENFVVKYYAVDESGNSVALEDGQLPTNAGNYLAVISFVENSPFDSSYNIKNKRFELVIHKIKLIVESWTDKGGLDLPDYTVVAEHDNALDVSAYYSTFVTDMDGIDAPNPLRYNTNYKILLASNNDNVEFAEDTEFEHIFKTGLNPAGDYVELDKPELVISSLVWNNEEQTFEIADWDRLQEYLEFTIDCDSLTQKDVGNYVVTLKFKATANATWLDGTTDNVSLAFEITKRHVIKPMLSNEDGSALEFEFNGLNAEYFPDGFEAEWMIAENNVLEALGSGTMTIKLLDKDSMLWEDETIDDLTIAFIVIPRGLDRPTVSQLENRADYVYSGDEIVLNAERDINNYLPQFMTISGELTGTNANVYKITISLIYKEYTYWKNAPLPNPDEDEDVENGDLTDEDDLTQIILNAVGDISDLEIEWQIFKATIVGEWTEENNIPVFVPEDETQKDLFDTKYFAVDENGKYKLDENGNKIEVSPDNMVEGEKYKAEIVLKDANNYEVSGTDEVEIESEKEFEYKKNKNFFQKACEFIKANWLWFVIGLAVLVFLILLWIIIAIIKRRKKKEEEVVKAEQQEENQEEKTEEQSEKEKQLEQEKAELQKQLDEVKAQGQANQGAQMNNGFATGGMGQQGYNVPPQYQGFYYGQPQPQPMIFGTPQQVVSGDNSKKDLEKEIEELKEQVKELKKGKLVRDDEITKQDKKLVRDENKLIKYILENFDELPNWTPFDKQDLIDRPVDEIIKRYEIAKQLSKEKISNRNEFDQFLQGRIGDYSNNKLHEDEKLLESQLKDIDEKLANYQKLKNDMQYETRYKQLKKTYSKLDTNTKQLQKIREQQRKEILDRLNKKND